MTTEHNFTRSRFTGETTCDRCGLLPLDSDDYDTDCYDLRVCVDCMSVIANGELPDAPCACSSSVVYNHDENGCAGAPNQWPGFSAAGWSETTVFALGNDEPSFSWSSCDGCGSTLGGDRVAAVVVSE